MLFVFIARTVLVNSEFPISQIRQFKLLSGLIGVKRPQKLCYVVNVYLQLPERFSLIFVDFEG